MKTNFKRIGKQSISIVLAVMMMLSTMLVGMVTSNAATVSSDGTGILYFNMAGDSDVNWWDTSGTQGGNFAYFYGSTGSAWSAKAVKYQDNIYYVNIPKGDWTHVILTRNSVTSDPNFTPANASGNLWNRTGNIELQSDKNYIESFKVGSANNATTATFSTVTPTPDSYSLSADKTTVGTDETVTLTPSFDSKLVSLKSNSYTVKKDGSTASTSDYSITENTITFNSEGTYTVSDTITYNAKGYSSIVGSVTTDEVTIIVNATAKEYEFYLTGNMGGGEAGDISTNNGYKFTKESDGVYTCTMKLTGDLYVTVTDKLTNTTYLSKKYEELKENVPSTETIVTSGGDKWGILKQAGKEIKITFNITAGISNGKIKWEYAAAQYKIDVDKNITNGTVTPSETSLAAGRTFTVTAEPSVGYELDAITVTDAEGKTVPATNESTHTYKMPASNVTVSATFRVKTDAKYSVTYTAPTGEGVVDSSIDPRETTLAAGTPVTVTVKVESGYTASLAVDGKTVTPSISGNTYTFTFLMPAQNITVAPQVTKAGGTTGTEIQGLYLIYGNSNDPRSFKDYTQLYVDSSNQVFAYFTSGKNLDTTKQYYFLISTSYGTDKSYQKAYNNPNNSAFNDTKYNDVVTTGYQQYNIGDISYYAGTFTVKEGYRNTVSSVKINLGYYKDGKIQESAENTAYAYTYEVIPTISGAAEGMPQVFAKDGTIRTGYQKYADMADTVLENGADLTNYTHHNEENIYYESASAKVGTKLKIKTTILPEYREKYFVKAFSINGYSYGIIDASQAKKQNGVYTCEYTIPEDFKGSRIEITPIYYYIDDKDTVTFYVEGFDGKVQEMWGNTIAVQAWYKNGVEGGESGSDTKNALGGYPGQPLVYQGGKYSMQIPKHLNDNTDNTVQGITLNNYFWDEIHKENFSNKKDDSEFNCQTYDFNDFYKLSETPDVDNIIFDFRYRTTSNDDKEGNKPGHLLTSSTYNESELELLKDYSGNIVNIFGNILSEDLTADYEKKHLTVISNGYVPITGIGNYATEWSVYAPDGTYINKINCSSLINENKVDTDDYTVAYNQLKKYKDLPVMIAYEKSITYGKQLGTRADGRWYFSKKADTITAKVEIEYGTDVNSVFNVDEFKQNSNEGTETGAQAYFRNAGSSGKTTCDGTVDGGNFSVHAQTDANAKYYFLGWYLKTSDGYSFITNESDTDIPMTSNATYVARFINTPSGTLTLSHTLLSGSADGITFIKADIVDSNDNVKKSFYETSGNIVIPSSFVNYTNGYSIKVTLRTKPYGKDTVEGFYEGYSSDKPVRYNKDFTGTGEQTYSVTRDIKDLFDPSSFKLKKSNIPFYSNITSVPIDYQITYTYDTRLNKKQSYVIKDTVSGIELEQIWDANKEQLSKAFIIRKAPFVSNYREEIKWNMDEAVIDGYKATVLAKTSPVKDLNISAWKVDGQWTQPATVKYGTLAMSNGDYLYKTGTTEFPETYNGNAFSFWAIFDNKEKADQYRKEVVAYMSGKPAEVMSDRLTALTKLKGYDNLISKSYSKEYNYISYQDYYIVPVYAGRFEKSKINESQASIRLLKYTRNQWTTGDGVKGDGETLNTGATKTDYLYTDFALSFDKDQLLIKNNPNIKVGIAFEVVAQYDAVKDDLKSFETTSNTDKIGELVKTANPDGNVGTYSMDGVANRNVYRYEINKADISVKNRIEYYLEFDNDDKAQQYVMKVYSYIYDTKMDKVFLSDPEYMNMYDIGNLTYITSGLASINLQPATVLG